MTIGINNALCSCSRRTDSPASTDLWSRDEDSKSSKSWVWGCWSMPSCTRGWYLGHSVMAYGGSLSRKMPDRSVKLKKNGDRWEKGNRSRLTGKGKWYRSLISTGFMWSLMYCSLHASYVSEHFHSCHSCFKTIGITWAAVWFPWISSGFSSFTQKHTSWSTAYIKFSQGLRSLCECMVLCNGLASYPACIPTSFPVFPRQALGIKRTCT